MTLDNLDRDALTGPHEPLARVRGRARQYRSEFARYSALPDSPDEAAWRRTWRGGPSTSVPGSG